MVDEGELRFEVVVNVRRGGGGGGDDEKKRDQDERAEGHRGVKLSRLKCRGNFRDQYKKPRNGMWG